MMERRITWSIAEKGFHVASRKGQFIGAVDEDGDEGFLAFDAVGQFIGAYTDIARAQAVVEARVPLSA